MDTSLSFRILFFILLGGMLVVHMYFNLRLGQSGKRFIPDHEAIRCEGVGMFAIRGLLFFVLITVLVKYAINHPWVQALDF